MLGIQDRAASTVPRVSFFSPGTGRLRSVSWFAAIFFHKEAAIFLPGAER
jgi:hypothetical protein